MTKTRKGEKYVPEIAILLRDAQPTWREREGEPDPKKWKENKRKEEDATDQLITIYCDHEEQGWLDELDLQVRFFCEQLKSWNGGKLPRRIGGRPDGSHRRLLIAMSVREAIAQKKAAGTRGAVEQAFKDVAVKFNITPRSVQDIYYDRDPEWMDDLNASIALRSS
jgi:hypothetical protein